jgi:uncharacterized lipoprotein YddW (UPF0748 family)
MRIGRALVWLTLLISMGCASVSRGIRTADGPPPVIRREMRGLWVATVANIDWPSRKGLSQRAQKKELLDILDRASRIGFNTIVLQVRPAADALYSSELEPWAAWLTGNQGENPGYDPLAFAVDEAHARGLQLHAWINPFRAGNTADTAILAPTHVFKARRDLVRVYGANLWLDPGDPESHERSIRAIRDIATRYDVDGIHADDYFYPYQIRDSVTNRVVDFPDDSTYARHGAGASRNDWRRENINRFVERMYREVHAVKPYVVVGLSPFGIWRPGFPESVRGLDAFATIYADSRKWLQQGWVDYFVPQLYWAIGAPQQSFPALLDWWTAENTQRRHVWPGLAAYRVQNGTATAFTLDELPAQLRIVRGKLAEPGEILYNTKSTLYRLEGRIGESVKPFYAMPAIVPPSRWLDSVPPAAPAISVDGKRVTIGALYPARWWVVRSHFPARWTWRGKRQAAWVTTITRSEQPVVLEASPDHVLVQVIDPAGNASPPAEWRRP